jgi:hypothetical protein
MRFKIFILTTSLIFLGGCSELGFFGRVSYSTKESFAEANIKEAEENIKKAEADIAETKKLRVEKFKSLIKHIESEAEVRKTQADSLFLKGIELANKELSPKDRALAIYINSMVDKEFISDLYDYKSALAENSIEIGVGEYVENLPENYSLFERSVIGHSSEYFRSIEYLKYGAEPHHVTLKVPKYTQNLDDNEEALLEYKSRFRAYRNEISLYNKDVKSFNYVLNNETKLRGDIKSIAEEHLPLFILSSVEKYIDSLVIKVDKFNKGKVDFTISAKNVKFSKTFTLENINNRAEMERIKNDIKGGNSDILVEFSFDPTTKRLDYSFSRFEVGEKNYLPNIEKNSESIVLNIETPQTVQGNLVAFDIKDIEDIDNLAFDNKLEKELKSKERSPVDNRKWLVVIGVENYDNTFPVTFSKRSANLVLDSFQKLLGIAESRTIKLIGNDATKENIEKGLQKLYSNIDRGDEVYFYYSGHGVPSIKGEGFILPKNGDVISVMKEVEKSGTSLKLNDIYKKLQKSKAKRVVAIVDSCFSGSIVEGEDQDNKSLFEGKGVAPSFRNMEADQNSFKKVKILTAGGSEDVSNSYDLKGHRLFSYHFLKRLIETDERDIETIFEAVKSEVQKASLEKGKGYKQVPVSFNIDSGEIL